MYQSIIQHDDFKTYIFRRIITAIIVFFLVTMIIFFSINLMDLFETPEGLSDPTPEFMDSNIINQLREELRLDKPLIIQYFYWIGDIFRGDFGVTYQDYSMN
jgi:ABC-type dipeptide/oligopeptide/nickel transport system permease component